MLEVACQTYPIVLCRDKFYLARKECLGVSDDKEKLDDLQVVKDVLLGKTNQFALLVEQYKQYVSGIVSRHVPQQDVPEVAHEVFVTAYFSLASYSQRTPFRHWLAVLAVRRCYDFWRVKYRQKEVPESSLGDKSADWLEEVLLGSGDEQFELHTSRLEAREVLEYLFSRVSAEDRMLLQLIHIQDLTLSEVARELGWSVANVKVRSYRLRKKLRKFLEGAIIKRQIK